MIVLEKVIYAAPTKMPQEEAKNIAITSASFWNIQRADPSGKGLALYLFYVQKAIDQNSPQPKVTDSFCAQRLGWNIKTVSRARKSLEVAKMISIVVKRFRGKYNQYVRIHFMVDRITGPSLSTEKIPEGKLNTYLAIDFYDIWFDKILSNLAYFKKCLVSRHGNLSTHQDDEKIGHSLEVIMERIRTKGYGISKVETQLAFFYYMISSVHNDLK